MVLAVIPARGGSKGIPRKNVRLMNGKPLLYYSIKNALSSSYIDDVVVSSDDEEILSIASMYGANTMNRDSALAQDAVTLDPVIYDASLRMEEQTSKKYDIVVTLQATSPLLSVQTLDAALADFITKDYDTYISAINQPHLSWTSTNGIYTPNYKERLNRQQLPPNYLETGAFLITRRNCMSTSTRIGSKVSVYEMPEQEAIDIDTYADWIVCEQTLSRKKILFRVDGNHTLGMGHIYRCLTLAYNLTGHDLLFVTTADTQGFQKLMNSHMHVQPIHTNDDFIKILLSWKPDIVVHDCLNTDDCYMQTLKSYVPRVITLEDIGSGANFADATINALYEDDSKGNQYYYGENYVCLKDEFLIAKPTDYHSIVSQVTVLFGGSDPGNYTSRIYNLAKKWHTQYPDIRFHFILGAGYDYNQYPLYSDKTYNIHVSRDVKRISDALSHSDLALTSQGRTVYELASLGIPAIVLAQNEREQKHTFAQMQNGFFNLGLGTQVTDETINKTFQFLVDTPQLRLEMRNLMLQHDLRKGIKRVIQIILGE